MNIKICKLVDGSTAIGNLTDEFLNDAALVSLEKHEDGRFKVKLHPVFYPFSADIIGINVPRNRIMCVLNETPAEVSTQYTRLITNVGTQEPIKPKATLTRIK